MIFVQAVIIKDEYLLFRQLPDNRDYFHFQWRHFSWWVDTGRRNVIASWCGRSERRISTSACRSKQSWYVWLYVVVVNCWTSKFKQTRRFYNWNHCMLSRVTCFPADVHVVDRTHNNHGISNDDVTTTFSIVVVSSLLLITTALALLLCGFQKCKKTKVSPFYSCALTLRLNFEMCVYY